jgi:hypothetical protein
MMKHSSHLRLAICALFVLSGLFPLAEDTPQPFSSDYVSAAEGSKPTTGKFYFSWPRYRMDNGNVIVITNYSTQISYNLFLDKHEYIETRAPHFTFDAQDPCLKRPDITCRKIGPETANGRACDKWETTDKRTGLPGSICIDLELHFPISVHHANGTTFNYINIKAGPQAASIFEVPDGYKKAPNPSHPE